VPGSAAFDGAFVNGRSTTVKLADVPGPRRIDERDVIEQATQMFSTRGYMGTSVADVTAELGLHPGSLYRTFVDKRMLSSQPRDRYRYRYSENQEHALALALLAGGPVLTRIRAVLVRLIARAAEQDEQEWLRECPAANPVNQLLPGGDVACSVPGVLADVGDGFLQVLGCCGTGRAGWESLSR
jgi:TetR/AcrR family transcriptional regulator, transcriptional repressor for nem operon